MLNKYQKREIYHILWLIDQEKTDVFNHPDFLRLMEQIVKLHSVWDFTLDDLRELFSQYKSWSRLKRWWVHWLATQYNYKHIVIKDSKYQ